MEPRMTVPVPDQLEYISDADGVTKDFPYPKRFLQKDEIVVLLRDEDGIDTPQILNTHYTIAGSSWPSGGTISFITAPQSPNKVVRYRMTQAKQTVDLENNQRNDAPSVETQLDRLTMAIQDRGARTDAAWFGLLAEVIARKSGDAALNSRVDQEIIDRDAGDKAVASLIGQAGPIEVPVYDTRLAVTFAHIKPTINAIRTGGYSVAGDGGAAIYKRVTTEPSHAGKVQSADGAWWELADSRPNVRMFGAIGDGAADDQSAIVDAVDFAYRRGADLYWPSGDFVSSDTIPNFHQVRQLGSGRIKRGSTVFSVQPVDSGSNELFVSVTGTGDGLDVSHPMSPTAAMNALQFRQSLEGEWTVNFAAGTYAGGYVLSGVRSRNRITLRGPDVGGGRNVPTVIFSGATGIANGLVLENGVLATIKEIKFQDYTASSTSSGLMVQYFCNVWTQNVHASGCIWAGINVNNSSKIYVTAGILQGNRKGIRVYDNCMCSIGYQGTQTTNRPLISQNTEFGVEVRDSSAGHVDYSDIRENTVAGLHIWNQSRVASDYAYFSQNNVHIISDTFSSWDSSGATTTFSGGSKNVAEYWSAPSNNRSTFFDRETGRFRWGGSGFVSPPVPFFFVGSSGVFGASHAGSSIVGIENSADCFLGLAAPAANVAGINFSTTGASQKGSIRYVFSDDSLRITLNATDYYRFKTVSLIPVTDNARSLGEASFRWSVIYAGTGTINTSDAREKDWRGGMDDAELRVAKRLSKLIGIFRWREAIDKKGNDARLHAGVKAQDVIAAFESEGLDPFRYGVVCYDEWQETPEIKSPILDEDGNETGEFEITEPYQAAGNRYGVRYDELWAFIAAGFEARLFELERA